MLYQTGSFGTCPGAVSEKGKEKKEVYEKKGLEEIGYKKTAPRDGF